MILDNISFQYSQWYILFCIFIAALYSFTLYFFNNKSDILSKKKQIFLASLRFLTSFLISLLLLNPIIKKNTYKIQKPTIAFAFDNSKSIKLAYKNTQKLNNHIKSILEQKKIIEKKFKISNYSFAKNITDSLKLNFTGPKTNISKIIKYISDTYYNQNLGALVIISDGIYNSGQNPIIDAKQSTFPIYTLALGDTATYPDIAITNLNYNNFAFPNSIIPITISFKAKKLKNKTSTIIITQNSKILVSKKINIKTNNYFAKVKLNIKSSKSGTKIYKVIIKPLKNEKNTINNSKIFTIKIIKNKQKILILANSPTPDIGAIYNTLKNNPNYKTDIAFAYKFNKKIDKYSLIILENLPSNQHKIINLFRRAKKLKIPLIFITGTQTNYQQLNKFNLGISIFQQKNIFDYANGNINKNFKEFQINPSLDKLLQIAPPLTVPFGDIELNPKFKNILTQNIKGINTDKPLIVSNNAYNTYTSNITFILGENIWRWRMYDYKQYNNFDLFDEFIRQIVQYTTTYKAKNRFIVKVKNTIPASDDIIFKAELYNKIYQLVNDAEVKLQIIDSNSKKYNYTFLKTDKAYKLDIGTLAAGKYTYIATTTQDNEKLKTKGKFIVVNTNPEAENLKARYDILYKIAKYSGGKFLTQKNFDSLNFYITHNKNIGQKEYFSFSISEAVALKWLFFIIITLLTIEWIIRKISGIY